MTVWIILVNVWTCYTSPWKASRETTDCPTPPLGSESFGSLNNLQYLTGVWEKVFPPVHLGVQLLGDSRGVLHKGLVEMGDARCGPSND
ncbi:hypothetical protein B296_00027455 [Ensete ventricosum]|uniref:Uncharacterized protein n=1 Tax=Ensete ventricosum TaxID=4639 RepID=A0A427APP6_ENSVE|nr:hypothetical protein B296_00027455 [Ensete ventricosum]